MAVSEEGHGFFTVAEQADGKLVQARLPEVTGIAIDQGDIHATLFTQSRRQFDTGRATTDNHGAMTGPLLRFCHGGHLRGGDVPSIETPEHSRDPCVA
ncbi:hypothetical protein GCM10009552_38320 [Rothia nasimurium]